MMPCGIVISEGDSFLNYQLISLLRVVQVSPLERVIDVLSNHLPSKKTLRFVRSQSLKMHLASVQATCLWSNHKRSVSVSSEEVQRTIS